MSQNYKKDVRGRTVNPKPVSDNYLQEELYDDVGRQVMQPYQVRDLTNTASATLSNGDKTELIASAGDDVSFADILELTLTNQSTAAATVELLDESTSVRTFELPANDTKQFTFPVTLKQSGTNAAWYADMEDITGTTVNVGALYVRNV